MSEQPQGEGWWEAADGRWYPPESSPPTMNGLALASLVCGLVSLAIFNFLPGAVVAVSAVVLGHLALRRIRRSPTPQRGRGMALAGLVLGYTSIVLAIVFWIWFLWLAD